MRFLVCLSKKVNITVTTLPAMLSRREIDSPDVLGCWMFISLDRIWNFADDFLLTFTCVVTIHKEIIILWPKCANVSQFLRCCICYSDIPLWMPQDQQVDLSLFHSRLFFSTWVTAPYTMVSCALGRWYR